MFCDNVGGGRRGWKNFLAGLCLAAATLASAGSNGKTLAEWKLDTATTPLSELASDGKSQLLVVDYLLATADNAYLNQASLTVLNAKSQTVAAATVELVCEVSTPRLLCFRNGHAYFETYANGVYHLTAIKIGKQGAKQVGELQDPGQFSLSVEGAEVAVITSSWKDDAVQTLTATFYDLALSTMRRQISCEGGYPSINPVKTGKPSAWELVSMTANSDGGIGSIAVKLVK